MQAECADHEIDGEDGRLDHQRSRGALRWYFARAGAVLVPWIRQAAEFVSLRLMRALGVCAHIAITCREHGRKKLDQGGSRLRDDPAASHFVAREFGREAWPHRS